MIENLFGSKTRYKLLKLFLTNPNQSFYVREITRKIDEQINSVRRELANLLSIGVIVSDSLENRLYYEVNQKYKYYGELTSLFIASKKVRLQPVEKIKSAKKTKAGSQTKNIIEAPSEPEPETVIETESRDLPEVSSDLSDKEKKLGNVSLLILSGIFTLDKKAPVDVLIVGNFTPTNLNNYIDSLESSIDKEITYMALEEDDFKYRLKIRDRITTQMLQSKKVVKIDREGVTKNAD